MDLVNAQADRAIKQSVHELALERSPEDLPDILGDPMLRDHKARLTDLMRQIADRSAVFTPQHPDVIRLNQQLRTLQAARDRETQNILRRIGTEYQTARRRENLLEEAYTKQLDVVTDQADKAIQYNLAKREVDTNRALYDTMLQKVREAGMAAAMRRSEARVIDYAKPPVKPASPNVKVGLALGMFCGLAFGLAFVSLRQHLTSNFESPGDTTSFLGVPELGVIPNSQTEKLSSRARPTLMPGANPAITQSAELAAWSGGPCLTTESFHGTLVSINFSANGDLNRRVLMITSADPSEGKTFSAVNLSVAASKRGLKVLLIDADLRKPRTHTIFGLRPSPGLAELLAADGPPNAASMAASVHDTGMSGLSLMPSGEANGDIACLLHSPKLSAVIDWARDRYDLVFVDTPPVLQVSDARVVSRHVDAVVFTVRAGKTQHAKAREALQKFEQDGTVVLGTVLTDWKPRSNRGMTYYGRTKS
jgi:capsular exopolysaccharide synthesis family protein